MPKLSHIKADSLEHTIQEICYELFSKYLSDQDANRVIEALIGYDGLFEHFLKSPQNVLKEIAECDDYSQHIYIPCYTVELRQILKRSILFSSYKLAAFPYKFAKRFLNEYNCLIALDKNKICKPDLQIKGLYIYDNSLDIEGAVKKVYCLHRGDSEQASAIENIVYEELPNALFSVVSDVPGVSFPTSKKASKLQRKKKYIVNIPSLGIDEKVILQDSAEKAVAEALKRQKKKMEIPHKDPKFTVDFWKRSDFWPYIVHEASKLQNVNQISTVKEAQTWDEKMRTIGEQPTKVVWLCGKVYINNDNYYLSTDTQDYKLESYSNKQYSDDSLDILVGKNICVKGLLHQGFRLVMSEWTECKKEELTNVLYMKREPEKNMTQFLPGMKVRHRKRGIAFAQITGTVEKILNNLMYVRWEGVPELEVFNLSDTTNIFLNLAKA